MTKMILKKVYISRGGGGQAHLEKVYILNFFFFLMASLSTDLRRVEPHVVWCFACIMDHYGVCSAVLCCCVLLCCVVVPCVVSYDPAAEP